MAWGSSGAHLGGGKTYEVGAGGLAGRLRAAELERRLVAGVSDLRVVEAFAAISSPLEVDAPASVLLSEDFGDLRAGVVLLPEAAVRGAVVLRIVVALRGVVAGRVAAGRGVDAARATVEGAGFADDDGLVSSSLHLPDMTRWAASATASAMSDPSLETLFITFVVAAVALSAASIPASWIARRALGLAAIAAAAAVRPAARTSRVMAALASLSKLSLADDPLKSKPTFANAPFLSFALPLPFPLFDLAMTSLPVDDALNQRRSSAVTVPVLLERRHSKGELPHHMATPLDMVSGRTL